MIITCIIHINIINTISKNNEKRVGKKRHFYIFILCLSTSFFLFANFDIIISIYTHIIIRIIILKY